MTDNVIVFPTPATPATCHDCVHARMGDLTYCVVFRESIVDEVHTAADCPMYDKQERERA